MNIYCFVENHLFYYNCPYFHVTSESAPYGPYNKWLYSLSKTPVRNYYSTSLSLIVISIILITKQCNEPETLRPGISNVL